MASPRRFLLGLESLLILLLLFPYLHHDSHHHLGLFIPVIGSTDANVNPTNKVSKKNRIRNNTGFYYGIRDDIFFPSNNAHDKADVKLPSLSEEYAKNSRPSSLQMLPRMNSYFILCFSSLNTAITSRISRSSSNISPNMISSKTAVLEDILGETLLELREMKEVIAALREEIQSIKYEFARTKILREEGTDFIDQDSHLRNNDDTLSSSVPLSSADQVKLGKKKMYNIIGREVEKWAQSLLEEQEGEQSGWKEVTCNSMMAKRFNTYGQTRCYIKWMKDSRGSRAMIDDSLVYPCLKIFSTVNASFENVCQYLSNSEHVSEYNDLISEHRDLEEISDNSKVVWAMTPQVLFVKPRDFVTYCQHWWKDDHTQVIVNQACDHEDAPATTKEVEGEVCRAYALRGANFLSRDPTDTSKTKFTMIIHANPGGGLPTWAMKTAINAVAPIEPFKLFYKINRGVSLWAKNCSTSEDDHISENRNAGLSQLGYACFWPK